MVQYTIESLLAKGFTRRGAQDYLGAIEREDRSPLYDSGYREWAHAQGFFAETACAVGLTAENQSDYLSDYDYCRVWPLNGWQRIWINDKLTLKYMLAGTDFDKYLTEYYYYTDGRGLLPLLDSQERAGYQGFYSLLEKKGEFACKPCNGECSQGFHKLSYGNGTFFIDNKKVDEEDIGSFVDSHPNYVFTEFLHPGGGLEKISPVIHTLRVLVVNEMAVDPVLAAAYLRFANGVGADDSKANYRVPEEQGVCSYNVAFDMNTGEYGNGKLVYGNRTVDAPLHPDTGVRGEGKIDCLDELVELVEGVSRRLGPVEYMGFDLCITEDGPRLIEINSHSGSKYLQLYRPFMTDPFLSQYFSRRLAAIDSLGREELAGRNGILH